MSLLTDLFSTVDKRSMGEIAGALGESDQSASRGLQLGIASVLGGMAGKSDNPNILRQVLDLAGAGTGGFSWSNAAAAIADPNSSLLSTGKHILSTLFGGSEGPVVRALGSETGLQAGKMSSLMAMAAPMVMSFLARRMHDGGMSLGGLRNLLQSEAPAIRAALPSGVTDMLSAHDDGSIATSPVVAQAAARKGPSSAWLLLALIPAVIWLFAHGRKPVIQAPSAVVGTANRAVTETTEIPKPSPLKNVDIYFEPGSMNLRPESQAKLRAFADTLGSDAHVTVNGYTDNVGSAASNLRLSQRRADAVMADLVRMGIPEGRLTARGLGEQNPIGDNATPDGRESNRRVSVGIGDN